MPKKPPTRPATPRKPSGPTSKPPTGGKSTKAQFGDYMKANDLGQSKGRSAAVGRRAASIKALANNTQGKIMSTNPMSAVKKPLPKSMIGGSTAKGKRSSGNPVQRAVDTVAKGAGKVAGAYVNATIKNPAKTIGKLVSSAGKSATGSFAGKAPSKPSTRPVRGGGSMNRDIKDAFSKGGRPMRGGGSKTSDAIKSSRAGDKSMLKQAKGQTALKARVKTVDYNALGKMMAGKSALPKSK